MKMKKISTPRVRTAFSGVTLINTNGWLPWKRIDPIVRFGWFNIHKLPLSEVTITTTLEQAAQEYEKGDHGQRTHGITDQHFMELSHNGEVIRSFSFHGGSSPQARNFLRTYHLLKNDGRVAAS